MRSLTEELDIYMPEFELNDVEYSTYSGTLIDSLGRSIFIEGEWSIKNPHEPHISHITAFKVGTNISYSGEILSLIATELERSSRFDDINEFNKENES